MRLLTIEQVKVLENNSYIKFVKFEDGEYVFLDIMEDYSANHYDAVRIKQKKPVQAGTIKTKTGNRFAFEGYDSKSIFQVTGDYCTVTEPTMDEIALLLGRECVSIHAD